MYTQTGWAIAPSYLIKPMHVCLTNISYTYNTPIQEAIAVGLETEMQRMGQPDSYLVQTVETLQRKRDELAGVLKEVGMEPIVPEGGYFILADTSSIGKTFDSNEEAYDFQFTKWMIAEKVIEIITRCMIVLQFQISLEGQGNH
jgi:kynurenine--oxoglutarate transaminase/cysteine-S-conjugate beta-lyase/glutamine--phenylpyruvate transaminase